MVDVMQLITVQELSRAAQLVVVFLPLNYGNNTYASTKRII